MLFSVKNKHTHVPKNIICIACFFRENKMFLDNDQQCRSFNKYAL